MADNNEKGYKLNPRGTTKDRHGIWLPRSQKHRYVMVYDKGIEVKYTQEPYPKGKEASTNSCCNSSETVLDKRFGIHYTCPRCTRNLSIILY